MSASIVAQRQATAAARAEALTVNYVLVGDVLYIASATTVGIIYTVTATGCNCQAGERGYVCKHAMKRLQLLAPRPQRRPMSDAEYAAVLASCDELV